MCRETTTADVLHPFEAAGLGRAPFSYVGMSEKIYVPYPGASAMPGGSCDFCANGIRYLFHVRSHDGKEFVVGCDCIAKLGRRDNVLVSKVEAEMKRIKRQQSRDKAEIRKEKERARIAAAFGLLEDPMVAERFAAMPHPRGFKDRQTGYPLSLANYVEWMRRNAFHAGRLDTAKLIEKTLA